MDLSGIAVTTVVTVSSLYDLHVLPDVLQRAVHDLSGVVHNNADLVRHVPALAAAAQTLPLSGPEKLGLVKQAAHVVVERYVGEAERPATHVVVEDILPAVVRAVLDVSKGQVKIGDAVLAAATAIASSPQVQEAATGLLAQCLACLMAPRRRPAA